MAKKAYLVLWSPITRVIAEEDTLQYEIAEMAKDRFQNKFAHEYWENIENIIEDEECPYVPGEED